MGFVNSVSIAQHTHRIRWSQHDCLALPRKVALEIAMFILLYPLAQLELRCKLAEHTTCSDASTTGGVICVSEGLTGYGMAALQADVRGGHGAGSDSGAIRRA